MKINIVVLKLIQHREFAQLRKSLYDDDNYKKINVEKNLKRGERRSGKEVCLSQKYIDKRPIYVEKKKDLISFCDCQDYLNIVNFVYYFR
jgi:hypothetical protein